MTRCPFLFVPRRRRALVSLAAGLACLPGLVVVAVFGMLWLEPKLDAWRASWSKRRIPRLENRDYLERIGRQQSVAAARQDKANGTWRFRLNHLCARRKRGI